MMKRSWVGEQKGSKGEVDDSGRGPQWERRGVWSPGFQTGLGVGGQLSRGLNSWSLKCPMEESSRPASRGWERTGWSRVSPQGVKACWTIWS